MVWPGPRISVRPPSSSIATTDAIFQGLSAGYPPYHSVRCGRGHLHPSHSGDLRPILRGLKELGLDTHNTTKLALEHFHYKGITITIDVGEFPLPT
eukprot:727225-Pelagomonas_calceolata.AAC.11